MKKLIPILLMVLTMSTIQAQVYDTIYHERIYIGTGEYNPFPDWHGILRFEDAMNYNSGPTCDTTYMPEGIIPVKSCSTGTMFMNFEHGFYLDETNDRMYVSTLFTNPTNILTTNPDTAKGSIAVFDNMSTLTGGQTPTRHIYGSSTGLKQPHGCWLDEKNDILYVANTFGCNILAYHNASTIDGNVAPTRTISSPNLGAPVYIYIDTITDRMFVAAMNGGCGGNSKVAIYNAASTINGVLDPIIRIEGSNTRLAHRNQTVHNVIYNSLNGLLAVGHHTHELLIFDLNPINLNPGGPTIHNLIPRVVKINDDPLLTDTSNHNLYGFHWDFERDIMYLSDGISNGGPQPGSPPNVLKVYENISDTSVHDVVVPDRTICWSNGDIYFPPQPIWVQKVPEYLYVGVENNTSVNFQLFPNPASDFCIVQLSETVDGKRLNVVNGLGQIINTQLVYGNQIRLETQNWGKGIYVVQMEGFGNQRLVKQ